MHSGGVFRYLSGNRQEMDILAAFLSSGYIRQGGEVKASELYAVYCKWADENNEFKMSSGKFGREMTKRFEKVKKNGGSFYINISVVK